MNDEELIRELLSDPTVLFSESVRMATARQSLRDVSVATEGTQSRSEGGDEVSDPRTPNARRVATAATS